MRYYLDTEFSEVPFGLVPISIALVREDRAAIYLVSSEFTDAECNPWVRANVLPTLPTMRHSLAEIRDRIKGFIADDRPEFWGYYADYDWVLFCGLFGAMINLRPKWPRYCRDLKQLASSIRATPFPKSQHHDALADAQWMLKYHEHLRSHV